MVLRCEKSKLRKVKILFCVFRYFVDRYIDMDRIFNIDFGNGSIFILKFFDREILLWYNIIVIVTEISKFNFISVVLLTE